MKSKQVNPEKNKIAVILFGSITDPGGGGGGGTDPGGGGSGGGGTQACISEMETALAGDVAPNVSVSSVTTSIDSTNRY